MKPNKFLFITSIALAFLILTSCSKGMVAGSPASSPANPQAEPSNLSSPSIQGIPVNTLTSISYNKINSYVEGGFLSTSNEAIEGTLTSNSVQYGIRLYYNDIQTHQAIPITIPGNKNGYLSEQENYSEMPLFTTSNKLVALSPSTIESYSLDFSSHKKLYENNSFGFQCIAYDETYCYIIQWSRNEIDQPDNGTVCKINLNTGELTKIYELSDSSYTHSIYKNNILLSNFTAPDDYSSPSSCTYSAIDLETGLKTELITIDFKGNDVSSIEWMNDKVFWQLGYDPILNVYDPETKQTSTLEIASQPCYCNFLNIDDTHLFINAYYSNTDTFELLAIDLKTQESTPLSLTIVPYGNNEPTDANICGAIENWFIFPLEYKTANAKYLTSSGEILTTQPTEKQYAEDIVYSSQDTITQYAFISKEDYLQNKNTYIPFAILPPQ